MMEHAGETGTIEYHLGELTAAVCSMQRTVGDLKKEQGGLVTEVAVMGESIKGLPCKERLDSCRTHMIAIEKLCNGKSRVCQSIKNRRSNLISAAIGGVVVGAVEIIVHLLGVF